MKTTSTLRAFILSGCLFYSGGAAVLAETTFTVKADEVIGPNTRFWQAAGHDYLFHLVHQPMGQLLLDEAEKHQSLRYFRTHFTFDKTRRDRDLPGITVGGDVAEIRRDGSVVYDFSRVNNTFHEYVKRGMKPIIEFGFFPEGYARDFGPAREDDRGGDHEREAVPRDWGQWEALQRAFMLNLEKEFGKAELKTWYFEVWNEPDQWPAEHVDVFLRMYDLFAAVVKSFDSEYKVGGPGAYTPVFLDKFLRHVQHGTNFVTGEKGSPLDFVSYHLYGISGTWVQSEASIYPRVSYFNRHLRWIERILGEYPKGEEAEFHLNEWGLASRFRRGVDRFPELEYRNNHVSPLFLVKLVDQLYALADEGVIKTDLLLYWGFSWEAERERMFWGNRELLTGGGVKKPILSGFEMLGRLRDDRLSVKGPPSGGRIGILPTREGDRIAILLYNYEESDDALDRIDSVEVVIEGLRKVDTLAWTAKVLDEKRNNSYARWLSAGRPEAKSVGPDQAAEWGRIEVVEKGEVSVSKRSARITIPMKRHSMALLEIVLESN
ncbi:MAG: hypothetical protein AAGB46_03635 [Verrucomicrobiota bacterium]